ncbi:hypothetical protein [Caballeronia sp. SBC2]|uniref:hypothetical protein n=1 Tax=Caballeronia sp. SBC2 TaxID=2705547 RepID=UPI0013E18A8E|nr:hypothetical protein [Caballeronia sp. SBC2]QIE30212.1 hypothetical protein SBC2_82880 [Caballeronia sp. SBC2]
MRPEICLLAALVLLTAGCATNLTDVATFANSTATVTAETSTVFAVLPDTCIDFESLYKAEYDVGTSALAHANTTKPKAAINPAVAEAAQNTINNLKPIEQQVSANCSRIKNLTPALQLLNQALANYASGLKNLSQDQFVTYNPAFDNLPQSLANLKGSNGTPLVTAKQVQAVDGLQKLIYSAAIQSYRQKKLSQVLNEASGEAVTTVVDALKALASDYETQLMANQQLAEQVQDLFVLLQDAGYYFEPIAQESESTQLTAISQKNKAQQEALNDYVMLLNKVMPAFKAAQSSVESPSKKDVAVEIKDFAKSAYDAGEAIKKAF